MSKSNNKKLVFVGMSGGVDSSVAAALLKERGFDVVGVHLKCYNVDGCAEQDAEDARRAAEVLGIPFYVLDFEEEYKKRVVEYMVEGYRNGITPNPDVMCNKEIKFGLFLQKALEMGADYVATGHYVRLAVSGQRSAVRAKNKRLNAIRYTLYAAQDAQKDQSYFLWTLTQEQLKHCLFPIGEYTKPEVRKLAKKFGLPNAEKKDSQGICFLGQVTLKDFLKNYIPEKRGLVLSADGGVVGEHAGAYFYTIGQRGGLGLGGQQKPLYVAKKDVEENTILVAQEGDPLLYQKNVSIKNVNFIWPISENQLPLTVYVRVRYRQPLFQAVLTSDSRLFFLKPQKFVAQGQSAVFYSKTGEMIGGGVIA
jgi:tRNA-specific 2-thiouridylase